MEDNPRRQDEFETLEYHPDGTAQETAAIELEHSHLPHLDDGDFIDWDRKTDTIVRGEEFEQIEPILKLMDEHRDELPDGWP